MATISAAKAFSGAMYTTWKNFCDRSQGPSLFSGMSSLTYLKMVVRATLVLPAPVGAATIMLLLCLNATGNTMD